MRILTPASTPCLRCWREPSPGVSLWCCPFCQGPLGQPALTLDPLALPSDGQTQGLWRYLPWLPVAESLSLGEPSTPLATVPWAGINLICKVEAALPTASFKDRGSAVMIAHLAGQGVTRVVIDSSGNAGASVAAYCARAGIECQVFAPESASRAKLSQIEIYGGLVTLVPGERRAAEDAAREAVSQGAIYAAHAWHPWFIAGTQTFAFELWEQLGGRAPDTIVVPLGAGTLLLGVYQGFNALYSAGLVTQIPRLYGVQSKACAPLARAFAIGATAPAEVDLSSSAAEGILIARPPRGVEVLEAVRKSGGEILAVEEGQIWDALRQLARLGIYVEPTSATAAAAASVLLDGRIGSGDRIVLALTGSGLKAGEAIRRALFPQRNPKEEE